jgi:hypothetical protein
MRHLVVLGAAALAALITSAMPAAATCRTDLPQVVRVSREVPTGVSAGDAGDIAWAHDCSRLYIVNRVRNRIEIFNMAKQSWDSFMGTRSGPRGMDTSVEGWLLYVANETDGSISEIDPGNRTERRIPIAAGAPRDLVVAANGKVIVLTTGGVVKVNPLTGEETRLPVGAEMISRSGDRRLVVLATTSWWRTSRYWSETDTLTESADYGAYILNQTGSVGIVGDYSVRDMLSSNQKLLGDIPHTTTASRGLMVDHAGKFAYDINNTINTSNFAWVDTIDLTTFQRTRRVEAGVAMEIPPGPERYFAVSPDDSLVAFVGGNVVAFISTNREAPSNDVSVFAPRFANIFSLLRFHNQGTQAGRARVKLANYDTGAVVHTWESPSIAPGTAPQFYIHDIEAASGVPFDRPFKYVASFETDFPGTAAHVTWYPGGPIADASTCRSGVTGPGTVVANVHSSRIGADYPSEITAINTGATAERLVLGIYDAHRGLRLATYTGDVIPVGGSRALTMTAIEQAARVQPPADVTHYVVKLEGAMTGRLQHSVFHVPTRVLSDMSTVCRLQAP